MKSLHDSFKKGSVNIQNEFLENLQKTRSEYGVSQTKLANLCGISRQYLGDIEKGRVIPSDFIKRKLVLFLEHYNPNKSFTMMFDYVRIRFPTTDVKKIIEDILKIKIIYFEEKDYGFYSYDGHYVRGDIVVMVSADDKKGVLLELKGRGCRQFESYLQAQKRTWYDFFMDCESYGGIYKRIDLAIDDTKGILDIPRLIDKMKKGEVVTLFRTYKEFTSGTTRREEGDCNRGSTLNIGSTSSEIYFCIYQKDYEQYVKYDIPLEETETKNRFEIRLKDDRAKNAIADILEYRDAYKTAFGIINYYLKFVEPEKGKEMRDCELDAEWECFIDEQCNQLKLTTKPEPYAIEKTLNWLSHQVMPTLVSVEKIDKINGTNYLENMKENVRLSNKMKLLIKQNTVSVQEEIVE